MVPELPLFFEVNTACYECGEKRLMQEMWRGGGILQMHTFSVPPLSLSLSVALFRKRTIPTERPPLGGEVSANFSG
jgi:hypothetical protein